MNDLQQLLSERDSRSPAELLDELREGLAADAAQSGAAAPLHALLQRYFVLDDSARRRSFGSALRRHGDTARELIALLAEDGDNTVLQLMQSLLDGQPKPTGAAASAFGPSGEGATLAARAGAAVQAGFEAFAGVVRKSPRSEAEIELSLGWSAIEDGLLDRVAQQAAQLAFAHGPTRRAARARTQALDDLVARCSIGQMLRDLAAAPRPQLLAQPSEWDRGQAGAPAGLLPVPVQHRLQPAAAGPALQLPRTPAAQGLIELYAASNGGELFLPLQHEPQQAGLQLIADGDWAAELEQVMVWLTLGGEAAPDWATSLVPFAALPGDASRWVVPLQGPLAGAVLYANEDVADGKARYASVAHFIAALRRCPEQVLGVGGFVSYVLPEHDVLFYPQGYVDDASGA